MKNTPFGVAFLARITTRLLRWIDIQILSILTTLLRLIQAFIRFQNSSYSFKEYFLHFTDVGSTGKWIQETIYLISYRSNVCKESIGFSFSKKNIIILGESKTGFSFSFIKNGYRDKVNFQLIGSVIVHPPII